MGSRAACREMVSYLLGCSLAARRIEYWGGCGLQLVGWAWVLQKDEAAGRGHER